MDKRLILSMVDHTLLSPTATTAEIHALCDEGIRYKTASVCIPPCYVSEVKRYVDGRLPVCTVIGFPNGYSTTETKVFETKNAIENGADEIDMVIDICHVKDGKYDKILREIRMVKQACGDRILKVIIETCLLTGEEKIRMCGIVSRSGADFIKTSTGFSVGGATGEDIKLFREHIAPHVKIKAAGGIKTMEDAFEFVRLGASRLGTSRIVGILKKEENGDGSLSDAAY